MDLYTVIEALGAGTISYCCFFGVLAIWVYLDATLRGLRPGPPASAVLVLGWVALAAYLAQRPEIALAQVPVPVPIDPRT